MTAPSGTGRAVWSETSACALRDAVRDRWRALGLVRDALGDKTRFPDAPSGATFDRIADGRPPTRPGTQWQVERVLGWRQGTIAAIREDPTHVPELAAAPALSGLAQIAGDPVPVLARILGELTVEDEARLTALIRARRQRAS